MRAVFLGTSAMLPTAKRNTSAFVLLCDGETMLFDCGEGTQRQLRLAGISPTKLTRLCISHWHGDHVLGIAGLLQTLAASQYSKRLWIYGPAGTASRLEQALAAAGIEPELEYAVREMDSSSVRFKGWRLSTARLAHPGCIGFAVQAPSKRKLNLELIERLGIPKGKLLGQLQKGRSIVWAGQRISPKVATRIVRGKRLVYIPDTRPCPAATELAAGADLLVIESTFASSEADLAKRNLHLTAAEAGQIAAQAGAARLVLTHFSPRYKEPAALAAEAGQYFSGEIICAEDFKVVEL